MGSIGIMRSEILVAGSGFLFLGYGAINVGRLEITFQRHLLHHQGVI
jgi:hypothetical protein